MSKILLVSLVHNRKHLMRKAVESVLQQSLGRDKFSYLLFDNGSDDGSGDLSDVYSRKFPNIHVFHSKTNLGQQGAYNLILNDLAPKLFNDHDVMCILDSDDELYLSALSNVHNTYLKHKNIGASYSGFDIIDDMGNVKVRDHGKAKLMPDQFSDKGQQALRQRFVVSNPCGHFRAYRVSVLKDIGGFPTARQYATDYCIFGSIMEKYPVIKIDKVLYRFRQHRFGQIESTKSPQQTEDYYYYQKYFKERWKEMNLI